MPKKRNAERADGRIAVQVYLGRVDGKRRYKTVYGQTQKEANKKAEQIKLAIGKGLDVTAERDTFRQWADRFLQTKAGVSYGQYTNYKGAVDWWKGELGSAQIGKLRAQDFQDSLDRYAGANPTTGRPTAKRTLNFRRSVARQIMQLAVNNRVIEYNPADAVEISSSAPQEHRRALTDEEQQWIVNTPHRARRAAMIMMYSGVRRGEMLALTWLDADLKNKTIRVDKSVARKNGHLVIKHMTKTEAGMRVIDIPQKLVDYLADERKKDFASGAAINKLIVANVHGGLMSDNGWRALWKSYMSTLNIRYGKRTLNDKKKMKKPGRQKFDMTIPPITAHWLRHTFATLLYLAGVDVLTAKDQLGHSDIKTTLAIYTHLDKIYKRKSMAKLDNYLNPKKSGCKSNASQE